MLRAQVAAVRLEAIGTFSTEVWRVHVETASGDAPATLVLKRAVAGREDRLGEDFATEMRFYRELSPHVRARVPRYFAGGREPATGQGFLLVEDVGVLPKTDWMSGPSESHARKAVAAMGRMHAAFFGRVDDLDWIPSFADPALLASFQQLYARNWPERKAFFSEIVPPFADVGDAILGSLAASNEGLSAEPTLLHGDAHAENMPLVDGEVVLLDWAGPRLGSCGLDLGFFIPMSYPAETRPAVERALVDHHTEVLREHGVRPEIDPWLAYRRGVMRRVSRIVESSHTWPGGTFSSLPFIFHRCATAAVELDVVDLL